MIPRPLLAATLLVLAAPATAHSQPYAEPPGSKAGRAMINVRIGGALGLRDAPHQLALGLEFGYALTPDRAGYVILPLIYQTAPATLIGVPLGLQYDIPLAPLRGLYVTARLSAGYLHQRLTATGQHAALILPELGLKYVIGRRINVGVEPVGLLFGLAPNLGLVQYRLLAHVGVNF